MPRILFCFFKDFNKCHNSSQCIPSICWITSLYSLCLRFLRLNFLMPLYCIQDNATSIIQRPKLTLTRPKDPQLETAHRVRAVKIKSSAELEEEMLLKIPKFRARPLNKKVSFLSQKTFVYIRYFKLIIQFLFYQNLQILEAPAFPSFPKSDPKPPVFQVGSAWFGIMLRKIVYTCFLLAYRNSVSRQWKEQINMLKLYQ